MSQAPAQPLAENAAPPVEQPGLQSLSKSFEPAALEAHWGPAWEQSGMYEPTLDDSKPSFAIQLPPPNVTGTLHMGHAFNQTIMDSLTRYHRMLGENTLWVPGTDHAGIATQIVVERKLAGVGKTRHNLGRAAFIDKVWEWKEESGTTITQQMRRMGDSVSWKHEYFTMDPKMSKVVTATFVQLYEQGLIYRGKRLVNWDPVLQSAVSDLEVESTESEGKMHYILYPFSDGPQLIDGVLSQGMTIATTRPETMMADGALAIHPEDERYTHLLGKMVDLPLCNRKIPIIADDFVDRAFGSGCVKITGAHDFNDYACAQRHGLPLITIFTLDAKVNHNGPVHYQGMDRFEARKALLADLEKDGLLLEVKPHKLMLPICARTGQVIEPMLTDQWFVAMNKVSDKDPSGKSIAQKAIDAVDSGAVKFVPEQWVNTYNQWMGNIQDWCISRQLWWGHQIPAWYDEDGKVYVAADEAAAQAQAPGKTLRRDADVLDTWYSSALVPFSSLGWPENMAPTLGTGVSSLPLGGAASARGGPTPTPLPQIEDLRAIPWGFSWGQCRLALPGWYGFGSAVNSWLDAGPHTRKEGLAMLQKMYKQWPFFSTLLSNMDMVLAKSDLALASRYAELVSDTRLRKKTFATIEAEWQRTTEALSQITGHKQRLAGNAALQRSIRHRFAYIDPLHHLQVELIRRYREGKADERVQRGIHISINGIAAGLRNTG